LETFGRGAAQTGAKHTIEEMARSLAETLRAAGR